MLVVGLLVLAHCSILARAFWPLQNFPQHLERPLTMLLICLSSSNPQTHRQTYRVIVIPFPGVVHCKNVQELNLAPERSTIGWIGGRPMPRPSSFSHVSYVQMLKLCYR